MTMTKRILYPLLILALVVSFTPVLNFAGLGADNAYAAAKLKAPKKVKVKVISQTSVKISWGKVKGAKGYTVYQKKGSKFKAIKTVKAKTKTLTVKKLKAGTKYTFYVKAFKKKGKKKIYGKASKKVSATTKKAVTPAKPAADPTAVCENGKFVGTKEKSGVLSFKGIPYAKAPVGELRWQAPQAPEASTATVQAKDFGNPSVQANYPLPDPAQGPKAVSWVFDESKYQVSEDCLTLNVWTKDTNPAKKKPVMVWFHGGGFLVGSTTNDAYQLENFCNAQDMVMISVNYRLGIFGGIDLSTIPEGEKYKHENFKESQNLALLDDIRALEWIQENVAAFGGDPNNVTIFGNSAGAADITFLTATTNEKVQSGELFKRVIAQSGSLSLCVPDDTDADGNPGYYKKERTGEAEKLAALTGATNLDELMAVPEEKMIKAYTEYYNPADMAAGTFPMGANPEATAILCYDNVYTPVFNDAAGLLPKDPYELVEEGAGKNIDVMYGSNQNEWNYWIWEMSAFDTDPETYAPIPLMDNDYYAYTFGMIPEKMGELNATIAEDETAKNNVEQYLNLERVKGLTNEYARERTNAEWKDVLAALYYMPAEAITDDMLNGFLASNPQQTEADVWKNTEIESDVVFRAPAIKAAADHADAAKAANTGAKTYMYYWAKETDQKYQKAGHASEISYVMGNPNHTCFSGTVDTSFSKKIQGMWANFARTGDPGEGWTEYDSTDRATMTMGLMGDEKDTTLQMVNMVENTGTDDVDKLRDALAKQNELIEPLLKYHLK